jgi:SAM-dependent methyltransferase
VGRCGRFKARLAVASQLRKTLGNESSADGARMNSPVRRLFWKLNPELGYKLDYYLFKRKPRKTDVTEIFTDIYARNKWGGAAGDFYSGCGSDDQPAERFAELVNEFITAHGIKSVVDLGCGDFRVGARFAKPTLHYTGVDVVPGLVERNERRFGSDHVSFEVRDIIRDELPQAELCVIRQVLQHLSNVQIESILAKLGQYTYVIVAEHHPAPDHLRRPNADKPAGGDIRIKFDSGVFLEHSPFLMKNAMVFDRLELPSIKYSGEILTVYLVDNSDLK